MLADDLGYHSLGSFGQQRVRTLGTELQKAGYVTAIAGKWVLGGPHSTGLPTLQGFDLFFGYLDQKQAHNYYPTHLWRNETRVNMPNEPFSVHPQDIDIQDPDDPDSYARYAGNEYSADVIHDRAMQFIRTHKDWFILWIG